MIYRVETYINDEGAEIDKLISDTEEKLAAVIYLPNPVQTQMGVLVLTYRFRIPLDPKYTLETALEEYETILQNFMSQQAAPKSSNKIVTPSNPSLIIP